MKKLRRKNGFTLVECIVAMAVLAIMSLLLTMILSVTLRIRNENMKLENDIDKQIDKLASGEGVKEAYNNGIAFNGFTIPGNSNPNVSANKVSGDNDGVSKLEFDFSNYFAAMGEPPKLDNNKDPDKIEVGDWEKTAPCFGHVDLKTGTVNIVETKNLDAATKIYDVTWKVKFTVRSYTAIDSVKLTLPIGSKFKSWSTPTGAEKGEWNSDGIGYTRKITQYIVMIQPNGNSADPDVVNTELNVEVDLKFTISEEDYKNNCGNLAKYFNVGDFPSQMSVDVVPTNN